MIEKQFKKVIIVATVLTMLLMSTGIGASLMQQPEEPTVQIEMKDSCHGQMAIVDTQDLGDYEYIHVDVNDSPVDMSVEEETESAIVGVQEGDTLTVTAYDGSDKKEIKQHIV